MELDSSLSFITPLGMSVCSFRTNKGDLVAKVTLENPSLMGLAGELVVGFPMGLKKTQCNYLCSPYISQPISRLHVDRAHWRYTY